MILRVVLLMAAMLMSQLLASTVNPGAKGRSEDYHEDEENIKYRFVVPLFNNASRVPKYRCTGTLISPNWVLTAANCLVTDTQMQYDELDQPVNETNSVRKILHMERPPFSTGLGPDLGLMFVESLPMNEYGQLSAVDYKSIAGHAITYVGFHPGKNNRTDCVGVRQVGDGVIVSSCNPDEKTSVIVPVPRLCIAPRCSARERRWRGADSAAAEPGSPLFHADKLVGVHSGDSPNSMRTYTPLSPYLSWIHRIVIKPDVVSRAQDDTIFPKQFEFRKAEQQR